MEENGIVRRTEQLNPGLYRIVIEAPGISGKAQPGQFIHVACGEEKMLRRPLSLCEADKGKLTVVFAVKGGGTKWLSERREGDSLNILGPLGHGFDLTKCGKFPALIGGGIGVPPLLFATKRLKDAGAVPSVILGYRHYDAVILEREFESLASVAITTDDGSYGTCGLVSDVLQRQIGRYTSVYCCGPKKMMQALAQITEKARIPCQVSLEERMGCGIGACLVCACSLKDKDGKAYYGHVCQDGPVFDSKEVIW